MQALPITRSCFVCGEHNPIGLKITMHSDGRLVRARFTPKPEHAGFREVVHGGILSTLLDELMVWACAVQTGTFAYCAELSVRFLSPARPGEELDLSAELTSNRRNRLFEASATIRTATQSTVASATGKYLPIPPDKVPAYLADFAADPRPVMATLARGSSA